MEGENKHETRTNTDTKHWFVWFSPKNTADCEMIEQLAPYSYLCPKF